MQSDLLGLTVQYEINYLHVKLWWVDVVTEYAV